MCCHVAPAAGPARRMQSSSMPLLLAARSGDDTAFDTALAVQPRCTRRSSSNRFTQRLISLTCGK